MPMEQLKLSARVWAGSSIVLIPLTRVTGHPDRGARRRLRRTAGPATRRPTGWGVRRRPPNARAGSRRSPASCAAPGARVTSTLRTPSWPTAASVSESSGSMPASRRPAAPLSGANTRTRTPETAQRGRPAARGSSPGRPPRVRRPGVVPEREDPHDRRGVGSGTGGQREDLRRLGEAAGEEERRRAQQRVLTSE